MFDRTVIRKQGEFTIGKVQVKALPHYAEENNIDLDKEQLEGSQQKLLLQITGVQHSFKTSANPDKGDYSVVEEISVSLTWHLLWIIPFLFLGSYSSNPFHRLYTRVPVISLAAAFAAATMIGAWLWISQQQISLLVEIRKEINNLETQYAAIYPLPTIAGVLVVGCYLTQNLWNTLFFSFLLTVTAATLFSVLTDRFLCQKFFTINIFDWKPSISTELFAATAVAATPATFLVAANQNITSIQASTDFYISTVFIFQRIGFLALSTITLLFFLGYVRSGGLNNYYRFTEEKDRTVSPLIRIIAGLGYIVLSYTMAFVGIQLLHQYILSSKNRPLMAVAAAVAGLPLLYFLFGLIYQASTHTLQMRRLFADSTPTSLPFPTEPQVRIWEPRSDTEESKDTVYAAASLSTGLNNYILITEDTVTDLTTPQLQAVVAHEAAHIESGEALLSFYLPYLSIAALTGRNLFYSLIDYHGREFEADRKAAQTVEAQPLIDALHNFQESGLNEEVAATGLSPFDGKFKDKTGVRQYLDIFFGNYAIRESHPEVEERIKQIEECR